MADNNSKLLNDLAQIGNAVIQGGRELARFNEARDRGSPVVAGNEILQDYDTLDPAEFEYRYGTQVQQTLDQAQIGRRTLDAYKAGATATRGQFVADFLRDFGSGVNRSLESLISPVIAVGSPKGAKAFSDFVDAYEAEARASQSQFSKRNVEGLQPLREEIDNAENLAKYEAAIAEDPESWRNWFGANAAYLGREALDRLKQYGENPALIKDTVSKGVGSLFTVGGVANYFMKMGMKASGAVATAVGILEGGSAYTDTFKDVMERSFEDLEKNSESYRRLIANGATPEEARTSVALNAAVTASMIQGPAAAVTGRLVPFEANPLARTPVRTALRNIAAETVEEATQSATGQLAQNIGVRAFADDTQSFIEDVAGQAVAGAVGGSGAAGLVQGTPHATKAAAKTAWGATKLTGKGIAAATRPVWNYYQNKGERQEQAIASGSGVSLDTIDAQAQEFMRAALQDIASETEAPSAPETGVSGNTYQDMLERSTAVFSDTIDELKIINDENVDDEVRKRAAIDLSKKMEQHNQFLTEEFGEFLGSLPEDSADRQRLEGYVGLLSSLMSTPEFERFSVYMQNDVRQDDAEISIVEGAPTPETEAVVDDTVHLATHAPHAINPKLASRILNQMGPKGLGLLNEEAVRALETAVLIHQASQDFARKKLKIEGKTGEPQQMDKVAQKFLITPVDGGSKGKKSHYLSLAEHIRNINAARMQGNQKALKDAATHLRLLAQSQANKAAAMAESIRNGGRKVPYSALGPGGSLLPADGYFTVQFHPGKPGSANFARTIHAEAETLAHVVDRLIAAHPELGIQPVEVPPLPLDGKAEGDSTSEGRRNNQTESPSATEADQSATDTDTAPESRDDSTTDNLAMDETEEISPSTEESTTDEMDAVEAEDVATEAEDVTTEKKTEGLSADQLKAALGDKFKVKDQKRAGETVSKDSTEASASTEAETVAGKETKGKKQSRKIPETEQAVPETETTPSEEVKEITLEEEYANLVRTGDMNLFLKAFRRPKKPRSRISALAQPLVDLYRILADPDRMTELRGGEAITDYSVTEEDRKALRSLLYIANESTKILNQRLKWVANRPLKNGKTAIDYIDEGRPLLRYDRFKAWNIIEKIGDNYQYNQHLLQGALLAGVDWLLNQGNANTNLDAEQISDITGIPESEAAKYLGVFNRGMLLAQAKAGLADTIMRYWNVEPNPSVSDEHVRGIAEAVATEILYAFANVKGPNGKDWRLVQLAAKDNFTGKDTSIRLPEKPNTTYQRVFFDTRPEPIADLIAKARERKELIQDLLLIEKPAREMSFEPIEHTSKTQRNNPLVSTTRKQDKAITNANAAPYVINESFVDLLDLVGEETFVSTVTGTNYRIGDLAKTHVEMGYNVNDWASVQGKQRTYAYAFRAVQEHVARARRHAEEKGVPLREVATYINHQVIRLGRLMQEGSYNPQTDKTMREVLMPTVATLDVSNPESETFIDFLKAIGQGLGIKTEKKLGRDVAQEVWTEVFTEGGTFHDFVLDLKELVRNGKNGIPAERREAIMEKFRTIVGNPDNPLSMHGLNSLIQAARYLVAADENTLTAFETTAYLEADGKNNGVANSLMLAATGPIRAAWLKALERVGIFFGNKATSYNQWFQDQAATGGDNRDLYEVGAAEMPALIAETLQAYQGNKEDIRKIRQIAFRLFRLLHHLDLDFHFDADNNIVVSRGALKNPMMVITYGSGNQSVANKITGAITGEIYAKFSEAIQKDMDPGELVYGEGRGQEFWNDLQILTNYAVQGPPRRAWVKSFRNSLMDDRAEFTLNPSQNQNLANSVYRFIAIPMVAAIRKNVGEHVDDTLTTIQKATHAQSVFMKHIFMNRLAARIVERNKGVPFNSMDYSYYVSKEDLDEITRDVLKLVPIIETGDQRYLLSGKERMDSYGRFQHVDENGEAKTIDLSRPFSSSLAGDMSTSPFVFNFEAAGVKSIATLVIGSGDGQMMLNLLANNPDLAKRVLHIFDGLNMSIDLIRSGSRAVNKAAFDAWVNTRSPVRAVEESFRKSLDNNLMEYFNIDLANEILRPFSFMEKFTEEEADIARAELESHLAGLRTELSEHALSAEVRQQVYKEFGLSVDQMAGGETPYFNEGKFTFAEGSSHEEMAEQMTARYEELLEARRKGQKAPEPRPARVSRPSVSRISDDVVSFIERRDPKLVRIVKQFATFDKNRNVAVLSGDMLSRLAEIDPKRLGASNVQKEMIVHGLKVLAASGYRIVFGHSENIMAWMEDNSDIDTRLLRGSWMGFTDRENKIIGISNLSFETLSHEIIHGAVADQITTYYENPNSLPEPVREAIARIEELAREWATFVPEFENENEQDVYAHVRYMLAEMDHPADALNEFLAWVLSNQHLARIAERTETKFSLRNIAKQALRALKTLIWGDARKAPKVADDLLSNLRFNTRILMAVRNEVDQAKVDAAASVHFQSAKFGGNARITWLRKQLNDKVIAWMQAPTAEQRINRRLTYTAALASATELAGNAAQFFGSLSKMQAYNTFQALVSVLMTDLQLNPSSMTRIEDLYRHVMDNLMVEDLMDDPTSTNPGDRARAQDQFDFLHGLHLTKTDPHGRSSLMSTFLALAMVDDRLRKTLGSMKKPEKEKNLDGGIDALIDNIGSGMMHDMGLWLSGERRGDRNVRDALDSLVTNLIHNTGDGRTAMETVVEGAMDSADRHLSRVLQNATESLINVSDRVLQNSKNRLMRTAAATARIGASLLNNEEAGHLAREAIRYLNDNSVEHPLRDFMTKFISRETMLDVTRDIVGAQDDTVPLFRLQDQVKDFVSRTRQQYREALPGLLAKAFSRPPSENQWTDLYRGLLETDLAALVPSLSVNQVLDFLLDHRRTAGRISRLESEITQMDPRRAPTILKKAEQLAHFMMTKERGDNLLRNAFAISRLYGERGMDTSLDDPALVRMIDELTSLYALRSLDNGTKQSLRDLVYRERKGVESVFAYLVKQREAEQAKIQSERIRVNHYKGYAPSEYLQGGSLRVASASQHTQMIKRGYQKVGVYRGDPNDYTVGVRYYYFTPVSSLATFNQGIMQTVHQTVSGVDPYTGYSIDHIGAGIIDSPAAIRRIQQNWRNRGSSTENLSPVYDPSSGKVIAYERSADPAQMRKMNRDTHLGRVIGIWHGRQAEEALARIANERLVDRLEMMYRADVAKGREGEYVNVLASNDPVIEDMVRLIPHDARFYAESIFGKGFLPVRRDMINDAMGYRSASVGDLFTGQTRFDPKVVREFEKVALGVFGPRIYPILVSSEKTIQEFVGHAKNNIVVKSVIVPVFNIASNMIQLLNRGVPIRSVLRDIPRKTQEINSYINLRIKEIKLEADLRVAEGANDPLTVRRLQTQLHALRDSYKRMSIWPLIEAGLFSTISNGIPTVEDAALANGRYGQWIENKVKHWPDVLRHTYRYGLLTRDTPIAQGLAKAVQYGDFVAKAVLYDHMTQRENVASQKAIDTVAEAFVNYNRLPGRTRGYLESVGLLWFYNYKLRILKEAFWLMRNRPFRALLGVAMIPDEVGGPLLDNFLNAASEGRLSYSIGFEQGLNSWQLHPMAQILR